jgi:hypothetical protein
LFDFYLSLLGHTCSNSKVFPIRLQEEAKPMSLIPLVLTAAAAAMVAAALFKAPAAARPALIPVRVARRRRGG